MLTDKDLADGAARREAEDVLPHGGIPPHEVERGAELARTARDVHAEPVAQPRRHEVRAREEVQARDERAHHVVGAHHLRTAIRAERLKDVVLGAIRETVKQQVDAQQQQPPRDVGVVRLGRRRRLVLAARMQRKDGHAGRDGRDNEVLVQRVPLAEERDVEEHDGQQLAALGEQEGDVVDVREARVAERAGEARRDGDEGERAEDAARRNDGREGGPARRRQEQVHAPDGRREDGLDRVEEDGEVPLLAAGAVRRRRELLLEVRPRQAARDRAKKRQRHTLRATQSLDGEGGGGTAHKDAYMPATEMISCSTPASLLVAITTAAAGVGGDACARLGATAAGGDDCPFASFVLSAPLADISHDAVRLLKYSDDDSRRTGGCFVRAISLSALVRGSRFVRYAA